MPQPKEKTPGTDTESRDKAVKLLEDIFVRMMRQESADKLDPAFREEIAAVVDSIIAAAKPGNSPSGQRIAETSAPAADPGRLAELISDIVEDVEAIPEAIKKSRRKPGVQ